MSVWVVTKKKMKERILVIFCEVKGDKVTQRNTSVEFEMLVVETGLKVARNIEFEIEEWWITGNVKDLGNVEFCNIGNSVKTMNDEGRISMKMKFSRTTDRPIRLHFKIKERFEDEYTTEGKEIVSGPFEISDRRNPDYRNFTSKRLVWMDELSNIMQQYEE